MTCRMDALRDKEVINVKDGGRMGFVGDVEVDVQEAKLTAVVVCGRLRLFGLLGREPDLVIPWEKISLIGEDTVLVDAPVPAQGQKSGIFRSLLEKLGL
ncbi:MAG: YlmC/YmxH family sporulation protein [Acutalibacter sp.]|jgi:YlmC/YmxH family sporulation protein